MTAPDALSATGAWDPHRPPDPELIKDCVHCGFCLPTCPSYTVFGTEMDSPRGRIVLMRAGHEPGSLASDELRHHFDTCLGCMACVTACPSGVRYDTLLEQVRPQLERRAPRRTVDRLFLKAVFALFTHPGRLRATVPLLRLRGLAGLLGPRVKMAAALAPTVPMAAMVRRLPLVTAAAEVPARHGRVALMQGCLQRVFFNDVNAATVRVLAAEGWEVHAPRQPRCCGALPLHSGFEPDALALARATIASYEGYDSIAVNVAGCGSAMKDYGRLLADDPAWARRAEAFSAKVSDVHELLAAHPAQAARNPIAATVAYHDACHLAHAQGVRTPPRDLLRSIPGLTLVEPKEWELCCGSAGTYNLTQPEAAAKLGRRKADNLAATGASVIAAANPGCALQIGAYLSVPVEHPMMLLDRSIRGVT
jgi:glycolate oxidase iron-sulfur subunit